MRLPFSERAIIEIQKLRDYCLDPQHPRGRHKVRLFASALGLTRNDAEDLRRQLLAALADHDAQPLGEDDYGTRYEVHLRLGGPRGLATIKTVWIIRHGEQRPRLLTCYPVAKGESHA